MSPVLKNMIADLEGLDFSNTPIPLNNINGDTLRAVIDSLKTLKEREATRIKPLCFNELVELVRLSYSLHRERPSINNDYLAYFNAVNSLDIQNLIKPALANLMIREIGSHIDKTKVEPKTKEMWLLAMVEPAQVVKKAIPKEFHSFIDDFIDWFSSSGAGEEQPLAHEFKPNYVYSKNIPDSETILSIGADNNKLYITTITTKSLYRVYIIDIESQNEIQKPIEYPLALLHPNHNQQVIVNNKIYEVARWGFSVFDMDISNDQNMPRQITLNLIGPKNLTSMTAASNKIFIADFELKKIWVIDLNKLPNYLDLNDKYCSQ